MPIYEYQCQQCGHHHEALQKISDPQLRQCPECGRKSLKRLVSAVRFRLAGSGWYETDFKSDKEAKRNLHDKADTAEAKTDGSGESEAGSKSEAKDAAKSDAKDDSAKSDSAKGDSAKSASSEPTGSGKRSRVSRPATTAVRSKSNGRTKKAARRAPAVRRRGR
ncbi:MAG TPA: zinc ribbon domain-containing protein [Steroidobacteraceae bacterium]|jgi:putative FmdB family regulatory protein|nr:zinc ribbon domain-containing protein [Steroidobacteraceae bacterium]